MDTELRRKEGKSIFIAPLRKDGEIIIYQRERSKAMLIWKNRRKRMNRTLDSVFIHPIEIN